MKQTWENSKRPSFRPKFWTQKCFSWIFWSLWPKFGPPNNSWWILSCYKLEIIASYHYMQFQVKLMNQTWENGKKPSLRTNFGLFDPNLGQQKFFHRFYLYGMLDIVRSYHCMQFQGKLMNQTWENGKKPSFWTDFSPFGPNVG